MENYTGKDHTFVICAYKENPYLEETIQSLKNQTIKSNIILSTSTPNEHIIHLCEKYEVSYFINPEPKSAASDWNYGFSQATTDLVTMAHQDDTYEPDYVEEILKAANRNKKDNTMLIFTDYYEHKLGKKETNNLLLAIKRIINFPLSLKCFWSSKFIRKRTLSIGCAICCPTVTFVKKNVPFPLFDTRYKNSCDYMTWVLLAEKNGAFIYLRKKLLGHRIYAESATSLNISENIRVKEDYEILCHYWPGSIAKLINRVYAQSEKSNKI